MRIVWYEHVGAIEPARKEQETVVGSTEWTEDGVVLHLIDGKDVILTHDEAREVKRACT